VYGRERQRARRELSQIYSNHHVATSGLSHMQQCVGEICHFQPVVCSIQDSKRTRLTRASRSFRCVRGAECSRVLYQVV